MKHLVLPIVILLLSRAVPVGAQDIEFVEVATLDHEWSAVSSAWISPTQETWLADMISAEVSAWDDEGTLTTSFGRRGPGPSEFGAPIAAFSDGDAVVVVDAMNGLKRFDEDGVFQSVSRFPGATALPLAANVRGGLTVIQVRGRRGPALIDEAGDVLHVWDDLADAPALFEPHWDVSPEGRLLTSASDDKYHIRVWDPDAEDAWEIDFPPVEKRLDKELREAMESAMAQPPPQYHRPIPQFAPSISEVQWLDERTIVTLVEGRTGDRIDVDTRSIVGEVTWPEGVIPLDIRDGLAVGIRTDQFDVPTIVIMRARQ